MRRSLQSRLQEVEELHGLGFTLKRVAEMTGLSYGTVRVYSHLARRNNGEVNNSVERDTECRECGSTVTCPDDGLGEVVCNICGLVVDVVAGTPTPSEYLGRSMAHALLPDNNLGSDEHKYLPTLKRAGVIKRLTLTHVRGRDPYFWRPAFARLSRLCMQANLDMSQTHILGKRLRRKLNVRCVPEMTELEAIADEVWREYVSSRKARRLIA